MFLSLWKFFTPTLSHPDTLSGGWGVCQAQSLAMDQPCTPLWKKEGLIASEGRHSRI